MLAQLFPVLRATRSPGTRVASERIVLGVESGRVPGPRPPVRIFIGSEPGQHRAERVLLWSIEKSRDRSRVYEIVLMKELAGFDRRWWLTGFTNYRFAVATLAGRGGRAIYNDVDQIYLADPAELFDCDMAGHGFLSVNDRETSVMLIDCAQMADVWTLDLAQRRGRKRLEARARRVPGLWGRLDPEWNASDEAYDPRRSKLIHYTTIHTQPWRPFPDQFVYQRARSADVWNALEREADSEGYQPFSFTRPSESYRAQAVARRARPAARGDLLAKTPYPEDLLAATGAQSLLDMTFGVDRATGFDASPPGLDILHFDALIDEKPVRRTFDGVLCRQGLESLAGDDVSWALEEAFRLARRFVCVHVVMASGDKKRDAGWWWQELRRVGQRHPELCWRLVHRGGETTFTRDGGVLPDRVPKVWILADHKPGHLTQSVGLAEALGWPYEVKQLRFGAANLLSNWLLGATARTVRRTERSKLAPPWPDVVIATGRRPVPVARWIGERSAGQARLIQLGRRGGNVARWFDAVVSCAHFRLSADANRVETVAPLNPVDDALLERAAARRPDVFGGGPRPHVGLLVGGSTWTHLLDARSAKKVGEEVRAVAASAGGTLLVVTSRRTGVRATQALRLGVGPSHQVYAWRAGDPENPYLALLAEADALIVTGDSESMLAEAVATGKPVYIYPLAERRHGPLTLLRSLVVRLARSRPRKRKGSVRPQQGLEYLCARLIECGLVQPPRDMADLHRRLIERGVALPFGAPLAVGPRPALREMDHVAREVAALLGLAPPSAKVEAAEGGPEEKPSGQSRSDSAFAARAAK